MGKSIIRIVLAIAICMTAVFGCKKKEIQPPQAPSASSLMQDENDASPLKAKVLAQLKARDYDGIYREAAPGFQAVGKMEAFSALWKRQEQSIGAMLEATEIGKAVRPKDGFLVYTYRVKYEKKPLELRLTFGRSKDGKMELTGINQGDSK